MKLKITRRKRGLMDVFTPFIRRKSKTLMYSFERNLIDHEVMDASFTRQFANDLELDVTGYIKQLRQEADELERERIGA